MFYFDSSSRMQIWSTFSQAWTGQCLLGTRGGRGVMTRGWGHAGDGNKLCDINPSISDVWVLIRDHGSSLINQSPAAQWAGPPWVVTGQPLSHRRV